MAGCKPVIQAPVKAVARAIEPKIQATVVTIQTSLQPQNKTFQHSIFIANGRARSNDELDHWRLFDFKHDRVTYVDDLKKTYYTLPAGAERSTASSAADGSGPQITTTGAKKVLHGVEATQFLIRLGAYQRELWIGYPPAIPPELFAMMRTADDGLPKITGFPLLDHAELPYGRSKLVVDHNVVSIDEREVPESVLNVRSDYKEIKAPGARRPPSSLPPGDQSTPATESQPSSTGQRTP